MEASEIALSDLSYIPTIKTQCTLGSSNKVGPVRIVKSKSGSCISNLDLLSTPLASWLAKNIEL